MRSGTRLTLYWDIFRDYILTERIPYIPVTYTPQADFSRYAKALIYMSGKKEISYVELEREMSLGAGATDNLVRDLINVGHVEASRKENKITINYNDVHDAVDIAIRFWRSHEIVRIIFANHSDSGTMSVSEFMSAYRSANKRSSLGERTVGTYGQRVLRWLAGIGFIKQSGELITFLDSRRTAVNSFDIFLARGTKQSELFLGEAPPERVLQAFQSLCLGLQGRSNIEKKYGRNTCYVLAKFGLMTRDGFLSIEVSQNEAESILLQRSSESYTIYFVRSIEYKPLSAQQLGHRISELLHAKWSDGSKRRTGAAVRRWAEWLDDRSAHSRTTL